MDCILSEVYLLQFFANFRVRFSLNDETDYFHIEFIQTGEGVRFFRLGF
jgi:hypothetical protein